MHSAYIFATNMVRLCPRSPEFQWVLCLYFFRMTEGVHVFNLSPLSLWRINLDLNHFSSICYFKWLILQLNLVFQNVYIKPETCSCHYLKQWHSQDFILGHHLQIRPHSAHAPPIFSKSCHISYTSCWVGPLYLRFLVSETSPEGPLMEFLGGQLTLWPSPSCATDLKPFDISN